MAAATEQLERVQTWDGGRGRPPREWDRHGGGGGGGGGDGDHSHHYPPPQIFRTVVWMFVGATLMFFVALSSAYFIRRAGDDWSGLALPPILTFNTALLIASSFALWHGRRVSRTGNQERVLKWVGAAVALGVLFLTGQFLAWHQLSAAGVYVSTNAKAAFFYVLTGAHAIHLVGGLIGLAYILARVWAGYMLPKSSAAFDLITVFWHLVGGVWLYLYMMLLVWT